MQWHLAAFETLDPHAGPGGLTLSPAPPGLARSGAGTAADARAFFARTGAVSELVKFHSVIPLVLFGLQDANQMLDLGQHAPNGWRIRHLRDATDTGEAESDQCFALRMMAAYRAAGLFDSDDLVGVAHLAVTHLRRGARAQAPSPAVARVSRPASPPLRAHGAAPAGPTP